LSESQIRNYIEKINGIVNESLKWISTIENELLEFILQNKKVYFSYSGMGIIPANIASTILNVITQENIYTAFPSSYLALHVIPYKEDRFSIIHFTTSPWERNEIARLSDAVYIMEVPTKFILPDIHDPILDSKIPENSSIRYPEKLDPIILQSLLAAYISIRTAVKFTSRTDMRVRRLLDDTKDYTGIVSSIEKIYWKEIEELINTLQTQKELTILTTSTMYPAGMALTFYLTNRGYPIRLFEISSGLRLVTNQYNNKKKIAILYTSTEEDSYRDFMFSSIKTGFKPIKIEFRTDPLSAPLYGVMFSKLLELLLEK